MAGKSRYRAQRIAALAQMRLHTGHDPAPPGHLTAAQAAKRLEVSVRTVERYKRELRQNAAGAYAATVAGRQRDLYEATP